MNDDKVDLIEQRVFRNPVLNRFDPLTSREIELINTVARLAYVFGTMDLLKRLGKSNDNAAFNLQQEALGKV